MTIYVFGIYNTNSEYIYIYMAKILLLMWYLSNNML